MSSQPVRAQCPSTQLHAGANLLGVVQADGRVAIAPRPIPVDHRFVFLARQGRDPHLRFRFSGPCVESRCDKWRDGECGLINALAEAPRRPAGSLPECSIRQTCRWFEQRGEPACAICPEVVTHPAQTEAHDAVA